MPGFQAPEKPIVKENVLFKAARGQAPLIKLYSNLNAESSKVKRLPSLDLRESGKQTFEKLLRIGVVRQLAVPLDPISDGALYRIADGDVRVAAIVSPGSLRTRLHFQSTSLPAGARVFVYSMSDPDEFDGPYEGHGASDDGTFWTPPLTGEGVVIEYFTPAGTTSPVVPFRISEVSHNYKNIPAPTPSAAGACNLEVPTEWANVAKSVGILDFVVGGFEALCTGTLLNDQANDQTPYLLTANHCIRTQREAQSVTVYWNYDTGDSLSTNLPFTMGSNLLVTGTASDFTLLRLTGSLPGGLFFSGWDANPVAASTSVTGIHHPEGSHKRISFGATNSKCGAGLPGPCSNFTGVTWNQGTTEPGSSGSGLWIGTPANAMLVGTLTGGNASCTSPPGSDYYGRFSVTYPNVAGFLSSSCVSGINPTSQTFAASGGTGSITVTAPAGCSWTASSTASFLTITSGSSGTGPGAINFSVAGNNGLQRSGSVVVGRQVFNVSQAAGGVCVPAPISMGQTINGTLSTSDCPLGDGSYIDAYTFNGTSGQQIAILMTSSAFDTFLYLLLPDGSVLSLNDDGGGGTNSRIPPGSQFYTLPGSGSFTILANSFDPGATGPYSLTLSEQETHTVTVSSVNPDSGVIVTVTPPDRSGLLNGATPFARTYYKFTTVSLLAPGTAGGNVFRKWQKDGVDWDSYPLTLAPTDVDHTMTAIYSPPATYTLTVTSSDPSSGVNITVNPKDNGGLGNGMTQFTRAYTENTSVTLQAPQVAGGNIFQKWQRDGVDFTTNQLTVGSMNANHTMTAVYAGAAPATAVQFSSASYTVGEGDGRVNITVNRSGDTTGSASVGYQTIDGAGLQNCNVINGIASPRCDYEMTIGTMTFAPGETSKTFSVAIVDDSYAEGNETFAVSLNNPSGATLGTQSAATVTIIDNDMADGPNPIDGTNFFVRQQYIDFLGREPDPGGFAAWVSIINGCAQGDTTCDRIHVSQNLYQSEEFQTRGYFVYRFYDVSFGQKPDYTAFVQDLARVSGFLDANQLEAAKVAFIADFMARPAFANKYNSLSNQQYVDTLLNTASVTLSSRQSMIDGLNNSTMTRAQVLRQMVESNEVFTKFNHEAFAVMEYFGYLRRNPDAAYLTWIQVLDQTNDPRGMITGFVNSNEYKQRFGP